MKKTTIFFALAIMFAALSFTGKVKAQSNSNGVLTWLTDTYNPSQGARVVFDVELYNMDIGEGYYFSTMSPKIDEPHVYQLGRVPEGNYRISIGISYSGWIPTFGTYISWIAGNQSGNNVHIEAGYYTELTDDIVIEESFIGDPDFYIYISQP